MEEADWSEDFLSLSLVRRIREILRSFGNEQLDGDESHSFDLEAYKLTGNAERNHGDIAFIVTRQTRRGPLTGVGFYEAKASVCDDRYHRREYPAFDYQQLRRLSTKTPRLSYLFYSKLGGKADSSDWPTVETSDHSPTFNVRTVDANFLRRVRDPSAALHECGLTFGYHFVQRILSGRELDYSRTPEQTVRRWLETTRRASAIVVSVAVNDKKLPNLPLIGEQEPLRIEGFETEHIGNNDLPRLT